MNKYSDEACEMRARAREQAFAQFRATPFADFVKSLAALFEDKISLNATSDGYAYLSKEACAALSKAKEKLESVKTPQELIDALNGISLGGKTLLEWLMSNDHTNRIYPFSLDDEVDFRYMRNPLEIDAPDVINAPGMKLFEAEDQCVAIRLKTIALSLPPPEPPIDPVLKILSELARVDLTTKAGKARRDEILRRAAKALPLDCDTQERKAKRLKSLAKSIGVALPDVRQLCKILAR